MPRAPCARYSCLPIPGAPVPRRSGYPSAGAPVPRRSGYPSAVVRPCPGRRRSRPPAQPGRRRSFAPDGASHFVSGDGLLDRPPRPRLLAPAIHASPSRRSGSPTLRLPVRCRPAAPRMTSPAFPRAAGAEALPCPGRRTALPTSSSTTRCPSPGPACRAGRFGPAAAAPRPCSAAPSSDARQAVCGLGRCHLPDVLSLCRWGYIVA